VTCGTFSRTFDWTATIAQIGDVENNLRKCSSIYHAIRTLTKDFSDSTICFRLFSVIAQLSYTLGALICSILELAFVRSWSRIATEVYANFVTWCSSDCVVFWGFAIIRWSYCTTLRGHFLIYSLQRLILAAYVKFRNLSTCKYLGLLLLRHCDVR